LSGSIADRKKDQRVEVRATFDVRKTVGDKVFGWASVNEDEGALVWDHEDDGILSQDLEPATYDFVKNARVATDSHDPETLGAAVLIESMFFSKDKQTALGIDLGRVGWWVGFQISDPELVAKVASGERLMFSIGGKARREDVAA